MKPAALPIEVVARTDTGRVREANEDSFTVVDNPAPALLESHGRLLVVADGMGGALGGETASSMVTSIVVEHYYASTGPISDALAAAVVAANAAVHQLASERPDLRGMGSTCTAVVLRDQQLWYAHVGDSRCYLVRDHRVLQLTNDHSKVEQMLRDGLLSEEEAAVHPERNVILRSIGPKPTVEVEVIETPMPLHDGDHLVLCSDGLSGHVGDLEILQIVDQAEPAEAAEKLIALANGRGGEDNITVQIAKIGTGPTFGEPARPPDKTLVEEPLSPEPSPAFTGREQTARTNLRVILVIVVCCMIAGAVIAALALGGGDDEDEEVDAGYDASGVAAPASPAPIDAGLGTKPVKKVKDANPRAVPDARPKDPPDAQPKARVEPNPFPAAAVLSHAQQVRAEKMNRSQLKRCPGFLERVAGELGVTDPLPNPNDRDWYVRLSPLIRAIAAYQSRHHGLGRPDGIAGENTQKSLLGKVGCPDLPAKKKK